MKSPAFPPILVVFDLSAILSCTAHEWKIFSRLGRCCVPQVLYEEIDWLAQNSPKPDLAKVAREFIRFWPDSGWLTICTKSSHPLLEPAARAVSSKQAQLMVEIAQCTYGLAQEHNDKLIVFASHRQPLLNRMQSLGAPNLCPIAEKVLLEWAKTGNRPAEAIVQWQAMKRAAVAPEEPASKPISDRPISRVPYTGKPISRTPFPTSGALRSRVGKVASAVKEGYAPKVDTYKDKSAPVYLHKTAPTLVTVESSKPGFFASLLYFLAALTALAIASASMWRAINPANFNQFWQKTIEPELPRQLRGIVK